MPGCQAARWHEDNRVPDATMRQPAVARPPVSAKFQIESRWMRNRDYGKHRKRQVRWTGLAATDGNAQTSRKYPSGSDRHSDDDTQ
jgi:hypothetical protein